MAKKSVAGEGTRFKKLEKKLESQGKSKKAAEAIAASIGRKKFGSKDMAKASAAGRKGKVHRMKKGGK
jgi:hypothetical protein